MEIPLQNGIMKGDQLNKTLTLNLDSLKGSHIIEAEREARMRGETAPNPLFSSLGCALIGAKASGHIADDIIDLPASDFIMVTNVVSNFLYGWVLPTQTHPETSEEQS